MKKVIVLTAVTALTTLFTTQAFALNVSGRVTDAGEKPVSGATVVFTDEADNTVTFVTTTDKYGEYELEVGPTAVNDNNLPTAMALGQNFPNPFNPTTTIPFSIIEGGNVSIEIYNALGQRIRTLFNQYYSPGSYSVVWNGLDDRGSNVAAGVYIYQIRGAGGVQTRKMLLVDGGGHGRASAGGTVSGVTSLRKTASTSYTVTINGDSVVPFEQTGVAISEGAVLDFIVEVNGYSISGTVTDESGDPIAEATVEIMFDEQYFHTTTAANGYYSFENYRDDTYAVSVSLCGWEFSPTMHGVTVDGANVTDVDFTGVETNKMTVTGRVVDTSGSGIEGIRMQLASIAYLFEAMTDEDGYYTLGAVADEDLLLKPVGDDYFYTPESMTLRLTEENTTVDDFVASTEFQVYNVSGTVVDNFGDPVYTMVHLYRGDERLQTITSDMSDGSFTFPEVRDGSYTIKVDEVTPVTFPDTEATVSGADINVGDITGDDGSGGETYNISGRAVDSSGNGIAGVTLTTTSPDGILQATTDADGYFVIENVKNGSYWVTAYKEGYTFDPGLQSAQVDNASAQLSDYVALD